MIDSKESKALCRRWESSKRPAWHFFLLEKKKEQGIYIAVRNLPASGLEILYTHTAGATQAGSGHSLLF